MVRVIKRQLVKRSLDMLTQIAKQPAEEGKTSPYNTFWESFGRNLKLGCIEDQANRKVLADLLRFPSSKNEEDLTSLKDYESRYSIYTQCACLLSWSRALQPVSGAFYVMLV